MNSDDRELWFLIGMIFGVLVCSIILMYGAVVVR